MKEIQPNYYERIDKMISTNIERFGTLKEETRDSVRKVDPNVLRSEAKTGNVFSKG